MFPSAPVLTPWHHFLALGVLVLTVDPCTSFEGLLPGLSGICAGNVQADPCGGDQLHCLTCGY